MDRIKVSVKGIMDPEVIIDAVGQPYKNEGPSMKLAEKVVNVYHHGSVAEHAYIGFRIEGISRLCLQELARHRIASLTVQSTRFVLSDMLDDYENIMNFRIPAMSDEKELLHRYFVFPDNFGDEELLDACEDVCMCAIERMDALYNKYKNHKLSRKALNDRIKYLLPENFRTSLTWTINVRSLNNFLSLRSEETAHPEIRHLSRLVYDAAKTTPFAGLLYEIKETE
jgi:thymidylate synthase (FAD)